MRSKLLLISLLLSLCQVAIAQVVVCKETNAPRGEDLFSKQQVTSCSAGVSGKDVIWDMSKCEVINKNHTLEYNSDTLQHFILTENLERLYTKLANDSLLLVKREDRLRCIRYSKSPLLMRYPLCYGDSISSTFEGEGTYCGDHHIWVRGEQTLHADGTGMLILEEGDTLRNVLRVKTETHQMTAMDMDTTKTRHSDWRQERIIRHDWYVKGYRYPLFTSIMRNTLAGDSIIASRRQAYRQLPFDAETLVDPQNEMIRKALAGQSAMSVSSDECPIDYNLAVNQGLLDIRLSSGSDCNGIFMVTGVSGIVYKRKSFTCPSGETATMRIDCSGLLRGEYLFSVTVNGKVYTKTITI